MASMNEKEAVLEQRIKTEAPPPLYKVVLLNDDFTPMDFVVTILQEYFNKDRRTALEIMLTVHHKGKGICGVFSKDVATTKVDMVLAHARDEGHPLQCVMEEA